MTDLAVLLSLTPIGTLTLRRRGDEARFRYAPGTDATLSVAMPPHSTPRPATATAWFSGLLPDNPVVIERWARAAGLPKATPLSLLAHYGADLPGAVIICPPNDVATMQSRGGHLTPVTDRQIAEHLRRGIHDHTWPTTAGSRWSLAGGNVKITLARTPSGWALPEGAAPSTHICKPGIPNHPAQALDEHLCLTAARTIGHVAAETEYVEFDGLPTIVIRRYDRFPDPAGRIQRLHQEDMCQALAVDPYLKYESQPGAPAAADIAKILAEHSSAPHEDQRRFAAALNLGYLLGAPDGHARNYSLLHAGGRVRLAPLYDVASALPYGFNPDISTHVPAMSFGGPSEFGTVTPNQVAAFAPSIGVEADWMVADMRRQAEQLPDALADAARATGGFLAAKMADEIIKAGQESTLKAWRSSPAPRLALPPEPKKQAVRPSVRGDGRLVPGYERTR